MIKVRQLYTRQLKEEALELLATSGRSANQLEQELGIGKGCLTRWRQELTVEGEQAFPGHGRLVPEQERLWPLERENEILRQERDISKKGYRHLLGTKAVRSEFIDDHRGMLSVTGTCKALSVSPSGCYAWRKRPVSARKMANRAFVNKIDMVYNNRYETRGSSRVYRERQAQGVACSEKRVYAFRKEVIYYPSRAWQEMSRDHRS